MSRFDEDHTEQANISAADLAIMIDEMKAMRIEIEKCAAALPGMHYMDLPDGGDVSVSEQVRRMAQDAARYRWLLKKLQDSYDGKVCEDHDLGVDCSMLYGWREERPVKAVINWFDVRDEPLNLSAAIDAERKKSEPCQP